MSQLSVILQESVRRERETGTILGYLRDQMDGVDGEREGRRRTTLKERLGLKGIGCCGIRCCGTGWGFRPTAISVGDSDDGDEEDEEHQQLGQRREGQEMEVAAVVNAGQAPPENNSDPSCADPVNPGSGMNLAAALAAERQFRATSEPEGASVGSTSNASGAPGTPLRVSLMRLLEETNGRDHAEEKEGVGTVGNDSVCCVCMGRKKGAAFIPCGHTYCRVCSRELWLNRGSCPLCNRSILEILDLF